MNKRKISKKSFLKNGLNEEFSVNENFTQLKTKISVSPKCIKGTVLFIENVFYESPHRIKGRRTKVEITETTRTQREIFRFNKINKVGVNEIKKLWFIK